MAKGDETKINAPLSAKVEEEIKVEPDTRDKEIVELKQKLEASDRKLTEVQTTLLSPQYQQQVREQQPSGSYQPPYGQVQVGGEDLEAMDNAQLARSIEERVGKALDAKLKVIGDYVTQLDQRTTQDKIDQSIASTRGKYKFFDNYKTSMIDAAARIRKEGVNALDILKIASWQEPVTVPSKQETVTTERPTQTTSAPPSTEKLSMQERIEKIYDEKVGKK